MYEVLLHAAVNGPARRLIEYGCDKGVQGSPS